MTTFQDPQPPTRRAVRQGERGDRAADSTGFSEFIPSSAPDSAPTSQPVPSTEMWDTNSRRAAQLPPSAPRSSAAPSSSGRRAALPAPPAPAEPLHYSTANSGQVAAQPLQPITPQSQPPVAPVDPQSFATRPEARAGRQELAPIDGAQNPIETSSVRPDPTSDRAAFQIRDFSPEGRRAAQAAASPPPWTPTTASPPTDLDYQTEVREGFGTSSPRTPAAIPVSQVPSSLAASLTQPTAAPPTPASHDLPTQAFPAPFASVPYSDAPGDQTLSRRELRTILAEQQAAAGGPNQSAGSAQAPAAWQMPAPLAVGDLAHAAAAAAPATAPAEVADPVWEASRIPEAVLPQVAPAPLPGDVLSGALAEFDALMTSGSAVAPVVPAAFPTDPPATTQVAPAPAEVVPAPTEVVPTLAEVVPTLAEVAPVQAELSTGPVAESQESAGWTPPVGHWSTQAETDDELVDNAVNRSVSSGSTATNALVLPTVPPGSDIRGPLTGTGEIMLTGSIDLSNELSSTGASSGYDQGGLDSLFDANDQEIIATDSAPVRAIKAVSTHSGHGVTHTQKPKGTRALTALLISASSMAVVVAGLLIAAFAFNIF